MTPTRRLPLGWQSLDVEKCRTKASGPIAGQPDHQPPRWRSPSHTNARPTPGAWEVHAGEPLTLHGGGGASIIRAPAVSRLSSHLNQCLLALASSIGRRPAAPGAARLRPPFAPSAAKRRGRGPTSRGLQLLRPGHCRSAPGPLPARVLGSAPSRRTCAIAFSPRSCATGRRARTPCCIGAPCGTRSTACKTASASCSSAPRCRSSSGGSSAPPGARRPTSRASGAAWRRS